jgi:hypothetical protein
MSAVANREKSCVMGVAQRSGHPVAIRHGDRQTGMSNESGWLDACDRFLELQADAALARRWWRR